ncbi:MAG: sulfite exporter TauE/SafE family protein [Candidatus Fonsibacter sp.]
MSNKIFYILVAILLVSAGLFLEYLHLQDKNDFNLKLFYWCLFFGLLAQLIDGSLGMAYGVSASTFLLSIGVPPVQTTAYVHLAEIFTTGASALSHTKFKNVDFSLFKKIVIPGVIGGIIGAIVINKFEIPYLNIIVSIYLLIMGFVIFLKAFKKLKFIKNNKIKGVIPLATSGGFLDAVGGGGWGPIVTTGLIGSGNEPRKTIGTVSAAEFFVNLATGISLGILIDIIDWEAIAGLMVGGLIAAPVAAKIVSKIKIKLMLILVGLLIITLSLRRIYPMIF